MFFETYRRSKQETSKREDVADQIEKLENQAKLFRKAFVDLEKETLKNNGTALSGTRRILPKEVYELEEEDEKEGEPKGWLSWFQGIYRRDVQEDERKPEPLVRAPGLNAQSISSEQNATVRIPQPTSMLSKILSTAHKNDSANTTQQVGVSPRNATTESNSPPKEGGRKSGV